MNPNGEIRRRLTNPGRGMMPIEVRYEPRVKADGHWVSYETTDRSLGLEMAQMW